MKNKSIKISIIIPCYNEEKYISTVLTNINKQRKLFNLEIIVVDDGSKDKTKEILKLEQVPDDKLTPAFDNSIKSLTEHWKFGWAGDTKKVSPDLLKKYGKDVRRMVKGRVDTSDIFKEPIQLSGKGIDWYEDLSKLSWEEIKKKY